MMENILNSNISSIFKASEDSQERCINFTTNKITRNINISSAVICSLVFLVGITTNGYIIWMKVYRLEKTFRSVLSMNLFISGFMWSLVLLLNIVYFACGTNWPFGPFMCQLNNFMFHLTMFISAFILILYSIDYFFVVVWPLKYNFYRRPHLASVECIAFWIIAICLSIPYFVFKTTYECYSSTKCVDRLDNTGVWRSGHKGIVVMGFILGYCIPLLIIFLCFITTAMFYHRKSTSKYTPALKLTFTFQTLFGVCWMPYHVLSIIKLCLLVYGEKNLDGVMEIVEPITITLASLNAAINPILYAFVSPDFKNKLPKFRK